MEQLNNLNKPIDPFVQGRAGTIRDFITDLSAVLVRRNIVLASIVGCSNAYRKIMMVLDPQSLIINNGLAENPASYLMYDRCLSIRSK